MRSQVVVPSLQLVEGLPREGFRYLEQRLSTATVKALRGTYPRQIERRETLRALTELVRLYRTLRPCITETLGYDHRDADLDGIIDAVSRLEPDFDPS